MNQKYKDKYRIPSTRLSSWNYNRAAAYFITICTRDKINFFGEILPRSTDAMHRVSTEGEKELQKKYFPNAMHRVSTEGDSIINFSEIGKIAQTEWIKTLEIRPDMNLELGSFIVMPNHFHAIIIIGENEHNKIDTQNASSFKVYKNTFGSQKKNLASIVRGYKSAVTVQARKIDPDFGWQPLYHDHIIRNEKTFSNISKYIENNPKKWVEDKFYKRTSKTPNP